MRLRFASLAVLILLVGSACQSGLPPTQIVMEVTRVVTVVVTPEPPAEETVDGPVVVETAEAEADAEAETEAEATETAVPSTPTATPNLPPTATPLPPNFPTPVVGQVYMAEQAFQNGRMFWLEPVGQIWILSEDESGENVWLVYNDTFEEGMPERDESIVPPEAGLFQPIRGFGKLWRDNENVRDLVGWAVDQEYAHVSRYEFEHGGEINADGEYVAGPGYHTIVALNGDVLRIDQATRTWEKLN